VVKLGTSLLTAGKDQLDESVIAGLADQVAELHRQGRDLVVVSSGAIAAGRDRLGLTRKVGGIPLKQVLASAGQHRLMDVYDRLFSRHDIKIAQALLSRADLSERASYLNARNTLLALLDLRVLGIVNENDVTAVDEIEAACFGDNDNLSAMVANLVDADLLLLLTDTGGLYTADPRRNSDVNLVTEVKKIDKSIENLAAGSTGKLGTGGMITKLEAARLATSHGTTVVIADGREPDIILRLAAAEKLGTTFLPAAGRRESRERWMLSGLSVRGKLKVDEGAATALRQHKRSLLAAGIKGTSGKFERGDVVGIYDPAGIRLGYGITNYSAADINVIKGAHSKRIAALLGCDYGSEVVHRNNLTVLD
jgi:glutamate 5-kinase